MPIAACTVAAATEGLRCGQFTSAIEVTRACIPVHTSSRLRIALHPSVCPSVRPSVRRLFVAGAELLFRSTPSELELRSDCASRHSNSRSSSRGVQSTEITIRPSVRRIHRLLYNIYSKTHYMRLVFGTFLTFQLKILYPISDLV